MSVLISGALINGAGVPMAECKIYLDAQVNTSEVVTESFAVIETDAAGQYAFEAQKANTPYTSSKRTALSAAWVIFRFTTTQSPAH